MRRVCLAWLMPVPLFISFWSSAQKISEDKIREALESPVDYQAGNHEPTKSLLNYN